MNIIEQNREKRCSTLLCGATAVYQRTIPNYLSEPIGALKCCQTCFDRNQKYSRDEWTRINQTTNATDAQNS